MKKRLLLTLAVLMGLTTAMATDVITSSDFSISRGETKSFAIQLTNEATNYVGFQMDLTLPEGLTINKAACSLSNRLLHWSYLYQHPQQRDEYWKSCFRPHS